LKPIRLLAVLGAIVATGGCYVRMRTVEVREVTERATNVKSPVKVHMRDGSTIVFPFGATIDSNTVRGSGQHFDALQRGIGTVARVPLDSVLGITNYWNATAVPETILLSTIATAGGVALAGLAAVAVFGSCPTFYTDSGGVAQLEAEGFSYSIAPLFESRDLDALRGQPRHGVFTLEMRNEALETHYINQLELLVAEHEPGWRVLPDGRGRLTAISTLRPPRRARDRQGRNVLPALGQTDGVLFETSDKRLAQVHEHDLMDHIDLDFGVAEYDSAAIVLRLRNSLLTTVLFYDVMLASAGPAALDWLARDLEEVGNAAALGKWYVEQMGLRVSVRQEDGTYAEAGRIPDVGPIAFKDVAMVVPVRAGHPVNVRISFPADSWRIDRVALAGQPRTVTPRAVPVARVRQPNDSIDEGARRAIRSADEAYLITEPGRRVFVEFDVGAAAPQRSRSFILAAQGYYNEWLRPQWLQRATRERFQPSDRSLLRAMQLWRAQGGDLERKFYATKIPTS
jgi:hypothetical protein